MSRAAAFIYSPEYLSYHFHDHHPFNPQRLKNTFDLLIEAGVLDNEDVCEPCQAEDQELGLVHTGDYLDAVRRAGSGKSGVDDLARFELGTEDVPVFEGMHSASSLVVGGTLTAAELVLEGKVKHAINIAGGLHHARRQKASGFCVYNDAAVAIAWIKQKFGVRILYIDIDAHHGDGVQDIFYEDPDVMVISIHESGNYLFPGTGSIHEQGKGDGVGTTINIPLEPFTEDDSWISAFNSVVIPQARMFAPDIIISQNGCDGHYLDPLTHLALTMKSYQAAFSAIHQLAEQLCDGRLVALGGGGYSIWQVVPRAWALLWSILSGRDLGKKLPASWLKKYGGISGESIPCSYSDPEGMVPPIPRREEIKEKNLLTIERIIRQSWAMF
ncbi:MAG: acetoin utilization protein AcuC [Bacillota bacterium]